MKNAVDYELEIRLRARGWEEGGSRSWGHSTSSRRHPPCSAAVGVQFWLRPLPRLPHLFRREELGDALALSPTQDAHRLALRMSVKA